MEYTLELKEEELLRHKVQFQNHFLYLADLDSHYHKKIKSLHDNNLGVEIEVLPSIYYKKFAKLHPKKVIHHKDQFASKIAKSLYNYFYDKQKYEIIITVKNIRDRFKLFSTDEEIPNSYYPTINVKDDELTYLNPTLLPYPSSLGGGASGCAIWSLFQKLDMVNTYSNTYEILSVRKMFEITSHNPKMLEICKKSNPCGPIIKKMQEGDYKIGSECGCDDIKAEVVDGTKYYAHEGKHRTCIAKRFNIKEIPILLTHSETDKSQRWYDHRRIPKDMNGNCEYILAACYERFKKVGLNIEDVRKLNESISDTDYVSFIEQKVGKELTEIIVSKEKKLSW